MANKKDYIGSELDLFSHAKIWKYYWAQKIKPLIQGPVLEVGAGIGSNTSVLRKKDEVWHQLEPDEKFYKQLKKQNKILKNCEAFNGFLGNHPKKDYQTIIYIDVLEHIMKDQDELKLAANKLNKQGILIVLSPAHQFLMSKFDRNIGHFRRYNKKMLRTICPEGMIIQNQFYLDSVGLLASAAAKFLVPSGNPTLNQILLWDRFMVQISRLLDPLLLFSLGKTVITVYKKNN